MEEARTSNLFDPHLQCPTYKGINEGCASEQVNQANPAGVSSGLTRLPSCTNLKVPNEGRVSGRVHDGIRALLARLLSESLLRSVSEHEQQKTRQTRTSAAWKILANLVFALTFTVISATGVRNQRGDCEEGSMNGDTQMR